MNSSSSAGGAPTIVGPIEAVSFFTFYGRGRAAAASVAAAAAITLTAKVIVIFALATSSPFGTVFLLCLALFLCFVTVLLFALLRQLRLLQVQALLLLLLLFGTLDYLAVCWTFLFWFFFLSLVGFSRVSFGESHTIHLFYAVVFLLLLSVRPVVIVRTPPIVALPSYPLPWGATLALLCLFPFSSPFSSS